MQDTFCSRKYFGLLNLVVDGSNIIILWTKLDYKMYIEINFEINTQNIFMNS